MEFIELPGMCKLIIFSKFGKFSAVTFSQVFFSNCFSNSMLYSHYVLFWCVWFHPHRFLKLCPFFFIHLFSVLQTEYSQLICFLLFLLIGHICFLLLSLSGKFFISVIGLFSPRISCFSFFIIFITLLIFSIRFDTTVIL